MLPNQRDMFKKGCVEMVILSLLDERDMYGYEICHEISVLGGEEFTIKETSIYPTLYRLLDKNFVTVKTIVVNPKVSRNYYHLEVAGKERLSSLVSEYKKITEKVISILDRTY